MAPTWLWCHANSAAGCSPVPMPPVASAQNHRGCFCIKRFHRSSRMGRPSRGGEKRAALCASPHEERGSDGAVAPPMCAPRVGRHRCVVREWYNRRGHLPERCRTSALGCACGAGGRCVRVAGPPGDAQRTAHCCATRCPLWRPLYQQLIPRHYMTSEIQSVYGYRFFPESISRNHAWHCSVS